MTTKNSHMVNLRLPNAYPLTGKDCGILLREIISFLQAISSGELETFFRYHPEIKNILDEKLKVSLQVPDKNDSSPWKQGFVEFRTFFTEVMTQVSSIVTTQAGKSLWNQTLQKRNLKLLDDLGGEL